MKHSERNLPSRQRTVHGITAASIGLGLALGVGAGIATADPATPGPAQVSAGPAGAPGLDVSSIAKSVQHQAADARAKLGRPQTTPAGSARPAPAAAVTVSKLPVAVTGEKPNTPARPLRDAIANLQKQVKLLNQLTGGALGGLLGPSR